MEGAVPEEIASQVFHSKTYDSGEAGNSAQGDSENEKIDGNRFYGETSKARTALPSVPATVWYKVTAASSGKDDVTVSSANASFDIKLSSGIWTLTAEGFSDSAMMKKILSGTAGVSLTAESPVKNDISITVSPLSEGTGSVNLVVKSESEISNDAGSLADSEMVLTKIGGSSETPITISQTGNSNGGIKFFKDNIPVGVYDAEITLKSSKGELKYSTHEAINVFQNLTTSAWQGSAPYFTETNGKTEFYLTKVLVDAFTNRTVFYVQGTKDTTYTPTTNAGDNNTGTYFDPFSTVQKAVEKITKINDGTTAYKIYVDGTVEGTDDDFKTANSNALVFISESSKTLNLTIEGLGSGTAGGATGRGSSGGAEIQRGAVIDAKRTGTSSSKGRVFCISAKNANITLKNITIKGGKTETGEKNGAGILLKAGNLTLSACTVTGNSCGTNSNGAGIRVEQAGSSGSDDGNSLTLNEGTVVSDNTAVGNGGGISMGIRTNLTINNATIKGNKSGSDGAGIYLTGETTAAFTDATITGNSGTGSSTKGGGIFAAGQKIEITSGTITENGKSGVQQGGGIYLSGDVTLSLKNVAFSGNSATGDGKSIYAAQNATINFAGSTVTYDPTAQKENREDVYLLVSDSNGTKKFAQIYVTETLSGGTYAKNNKNEDIACYLKFNDASQVSAQENNTIIQKAPDSKDVIKFSLLNADNYRIAPSPILGGTGGVSSNGYKGLLQEDYGS